MNEQASIPPKAPVVIKPTVGRKVWFWKSAPEGEGRQPEDATIVYVWNDRMVNLQVNNHSGFARSETSVPLMQEGDEPRAGYFAVWMPYQLGQARAAS